MYTPQLMISIQRQAAHSSLCADAGLLQRCRTVGDDDPVFSIDETCKTTYGHKFTITVSQG